MFLYHSKDALSQVQKFKKHNMKNPLVKKVFLFF